MKKLCLFIPVLLATAACGPVAADDLSMEDAGRAFGTAQQGTTAANGEAMSGFGGITMTLAVDESWDCPVSGTIGIDGDYSANYDTSAGTGTADLSLNLTYDECGFELTTIDGNLNETASIDIGGQSLSMETSAVGALWFTGEIEGSCNFNFSMSMSGDPSGLSGDVTIEYSGTVCGYDVEELTIETSGG